MAELIPLHTLQAFLNEAMQYTANGQNMSGANQINIGFGLLAIAEQLQVANKLAAAQVMATVNSGYSTRDALLIVQEVREEYGV